MKTIFFKIVCTAFLFLFFVGCSKDDSSGSKPNEEQHDDDSPNTGEENFAYVLTASKTDIIEGDEVTFTVTENGKDITKDVGIYTPNGLVISGSAIFAEKGRYEVEASNERTKPSDGKPIKYSKRIHINVSPDPLRPKIALPRRISYHTMYDVPSYNNFQFLYRGTKLDKIMIQNYEGGINHSYHYKVFYEGDLIVKMEQIDRNGLTEYTFSYDGNKNIVYYKMFKHFLAEPSIYEIRYDYSLGNNLVKYEIQKRYDNGKINVLNGTLKYVDGDVIQHTDENDTVAFFSHTNRLGAFNNVKGIKQLDIIYKLGIFSYTGLNDYHFWHSPLPEPFNYSFGYNHTISEITINHPSTQTSNASRRVYKINNVYGNNKVEYPTQVHSVGTYYYKVWDNGSYLDKELFQGRQTVHINYMIGDEEVKNESLN